MMQVDGGRHDQLWLEEARESLQLHWTSVVQNTVIQGLFLEPRIARGIHESHFLSALSNTTPVTCLTHPFVSALEFFLQDV